MTKAIALLSGGLDSILAVKLILNQGVEVEAYHYVSVFSPCVSENGRCTQGKAAADALGVKLKTSNISRDLLEIIRHPRYGYGKNMNPCIDCRIFTFSMAGEYMRQHGASFLVTGEVLGERPMSQRKDAMRSIERDSGLDGLILRPLSAKLLLPTLPEKEGLVDREKLLNIQGRSRKPQMALAKELGISNYPTPAGGCLLTDPIFGRRMRDLIDHNPMATLNDVHLLKMGRHFRLSPQIKVVVGRNQKENAKLASHALEGDLIYKVLDFPGPLTLVRGKIEEGLKEMPAAITARYSKACNEKKVNVRYGEHPSGSTGVLQVSPLERELPEKLMI